MLQKFEKWHGCKNDFIVTWISEADGDVLIGSLQRLAPKLCARDGSGIGADGILVLQGKLRTTLIPESLTIINSDGSLAANCGNGLRCAAGSIRRRHHAERNPIEFPDAIPLSIGKNEVVCRFLDPGKNPNTGMIAVEMGIPTLGRANSWHAHAEKEVERISNELKIPAIRRTFDTCEIANPHLVIFLDQISTELLQKIGPALQQSDFWDGINVHLCEVKSLTSDDSAAAKKTLGASMSELYRVLVWERGAGATQACGSGACAVAASVLASGLVERSDWIGIDMPGGRLYCRQDDQEGPVVLAGPAEFVFEGVIEI